VIWVYDGSVLHHGWLPTRAEMGRRWNHRQSGVFLSGGTGRKARLDNTRKVLFSV